MNDAKTDNFVMTGVLAGIAFPIAIYLSLALTQLGFNKFNYVLAGGKKFATFPDLSAHTGISLAYLALVVIHVVWVLGHWGTAQLPNFRQVLKRVAVFLLLAYVIYPLGNDLYLYLHFGRMNLSHVSPFLTPAGDFTSELSPFVDWKQTATYGPVSQFLFTIAAAMMAIHPLAPVYGFKAFCLAAHIVNGYLVWRLVPQSQRSKLAIAYLVAPVLLLEQVGSAHVDVFVSTCILLLAACLFSKRYALGVLALWGGFLSKTIPIIWMPMLVVFLLRRRRWRQLALALFLLLAIAAGLAMTVLPSLQAWRSLLNPGVTGQYQSSVHALLRAGWETLPYFVADAPPASEYKYYLLRLAHYTLVGFAVFYLWTLLRMLQRTPYTAATLLEDMGWVTTVLMLYATTWLMPWYVSILYAIAAVLPQARLFGLTTLMFGVASSAMYGLQNDSGLRSLVTVGLPTLTILVGAVLLRPSRSPKPGKKPVA